MIEKSVTENGEYYAKDDNADGYSSVKVEVPSAPVPETFAVTLNIEYVDTTSFNFSSSKTLQEALTAHTEGKLLDFTINWTKQGRTTTSTNSNYLYLNDSGLTYFAISFVLSDSGQSILYPLLWADDSIAGTVVSQPYLIVAPNA